MKAAGALAGLPRGLLKRDTSRRYKMIRRRNKVGDRMTHMQSHTTPTKWTVPTSGGQSKGAQPVFLRLYPTIVLSRLIAEERNR